MQKSLLLSLTISALFMSTQAITAAGVGEIIAGIMDGVIQKDDLKEIQACLVGGDNLSVNIENAVADFKEGDLAGTAEGFMEIQQFVTKLPAAIGTCEEIRDDLNKFAEWAVIFIEPTVFIKTVSSNLVWNYFEIHSDIEEAITDFDKQDYFDFGLKIGEALVIVTKQ